MNVLRTFLVIAALLIVEGYGNCGCLKCNKQQFRVLTPPGTNLKVIYKGDSCNCPMSLPYSVQIPVETPPPVSGLSYEYQVQPEQPKPIHYHHVPQSHNVRLQIPVESPAPPYLVDLVAAPDRLLIGAPPAPAVPPGYPQPIFEEVKAVEKDLADLTGFYYAPQPTTCGCSCSRYAKKVLPRAYLDAHLRYRTLWTLNWDNRRRTLTPFQRYWYQSRRFHQKFLLSDSYRHISTMAEFPSITQMMVKTFNPHILRRSNRETFFPTCPRHRNDSNINSYILSSSHYSTSKLDTFMFVRPKRAINWQSLAKQPQYYPVHQQQYLLSPKDKPVTPIKGNGRPLCADCKRKQAASTLKQNVQKKSKKKNALAKLKAKQKKAHVKLHFKIISKFVKNWLSKGNPSEPPTVQLPPGIQFHNQPEPRWSNELPEKSHSRKKALGRSKRAIRKRKKNEDPFPYFSYPYENREPESEVFHKKHTDDFLEPFNYGNLLHPTPLLHLLNTPIRYLNHMHKLRSHISPVVGTIPKVMQVSKRYLVDVLKHFGKNALKLGTNFIKGFTKIKKPKLLPKLKHKRSVDEVKSRDNGEIDPKELDEFIEDLVKFFANYGISLKVVDDSDVDNSASNAINLKNPEEDISLKVWINKLLQESTDYEINEEATDKKKQNELLESKPFYGLASNVNNVSSRRKRCLCQACHNDAEYCDCQYPSRRKRETEDLDIGKLNNNSPEDNLSKNKRDINSKKEVFRTDESVMFDIEKDQNNKYEAPQEVKRFLGRPENPSSVFDRFLTDGDDPREFLKGENKRNWYRQKRDTLSKLPYNSEMWKRVLRFREDQAEIRESKLRRRHVSAAAAPLPSVSKTTKRQNDLEVNTHHIQTIEKKINDTTFKIKELFRLNLFNYLKIFQDMQKINYIKKNIIEQRQNNLLQDKNLVADTNTIEVLKNSVFREIFKHLSDTDVYFKDTWVAILVKLQKLHCIIKNLNTRPSKFYLDLLDKVTLHSFENYQELFTYLQILQQRELDKEITFLESLHDILAEENKERIVKESGIIWEMNNIEKLQKVSVLELNEKMAGGKSIRRELKILFDLQKQLRHCEGRQRALIKETVSDRR